MVEMIKGTRSGFEGGGGLLSLLGRFVWIIVAAPSRLSFINWGPH